MVFAIPREGKTYVGTTDTVYKADIAHPTMTEEDRDYVLSAIHFMFPDVALGPEDIESSWAGLCPLIHEDGKDPSEISRKDEIFVSDSGLISIAGGKLTGYRKMAESVVDRVATNLNNMTGATYPPSATKHLPISGGDVGGAAGFIVYTADQLVEGINLGLTEDEVRLVINRYGSNVKTVFDFCRKEAELAEESGLDPLVYAMLRYALVYESCYKPVDFFIRRTGALFFDINWVHKYKEAVIAYMANQFSWSTEQVETYMEELEQLLYEATNPVDDYITEKEIQKVK